MNQRTIGIEIGSQNVHVVDCLSEAGRTTIQGMYSFRLSEDEIENGQAFQNLSQKIYANKQQIDAIGLAVDSTSALVAKKVLAFNDPHVIDQVLGLTMSDTWTITEDSHMSFEVGGQVKATGEEETDGYEVTVLHYSRQKLLDQINRLRQYRFDPHVILPGVQALPYTLGTFFQFDSRVNVLIDIGACNTMLAIVDDNRIVMTRSFKLGSYQIDEAISQALNISLEEAETVKCEKGFIAVPGKELEVFAKRRSQSVLDEGEAVDPIVLGNACRQGMQLLFTNINQTLMRFAMKNNTEPTCISLTGNGARLFGLDRWFSEMFGVQCVYRLPARTDCSSLDFSLNATSVAIAAVQNLSGQCPLNLRRGSLAHKGSLEYFKDNIWIIASVAVLMIIAAVFMMFSRYKNVMSEHDQVRAALEKTTKEVFGKRLLSTTAIKKEVASSEGFNFLPTITAFDHFMWLSNEITNNLSDVEMDLSVLEINTLTKVVILRGDISGEEGMPRFLQLLEQYECFPNEILDPGTNNMTKDKRSFNLRIDAKCGTGGTEDGQ